MSDERFVISSRVRLARNYDDLPFDTTTSDGLADTCVTRTASALARSGDDMGFELIRLRDLTDLQRRTMVEDHVISQDLLRAPSAAAVLAAPDSGLSVMINEDDHLRIQAIRSGLDLLGAAQLVFRIDDALSRQTRFAFDEQLGYLTSRPTDTGTGMRASLLMHLPLLTTCKQMGNVSQIIAKLGLNIRGVYGEGTEALGNIYLISNQVALGRTEQELITALDAFAHQLIHMENNLRAGALKNGRIALEDSVYRAYGVLKNARLINEEEFFRQWSFMRLGCELGLLPESPQMLDALLDQVQEAHLCAWAEQPLSGEKLNEVRASRIRDLLDAAVTL